MQRSTPEANAGFSRLPASMVPPEAEPAPTSVWISSMNRIAPGCFSSAREHLLDALLEVAAVARAGDQRAEVERVDLRAASARRHGVLGDAQRQPLGQRRLPHSGLADQQRIVLPPPAQHLDDAVELEAAADQRIDLSASRLLDQFHRVGRQRILRAGSPRPRAGARRAPPAGSAWAIAFNSRSRFTPCFFRK